MSVKKETSKKIAILKKYSDMLYDSKEYEIDINGNMINNEIYIASIVKKMDEHFYSDLHNIYFDYYNKKDKTTITRKDHQALDNIFFTCRLILNNMQKAFQRQIDMNKIDKKVKVLSKYSQKFADLNDQSFYHIYNE
jgi:hypothetical protein